jgi:hypothetical protein
LKSGSLNLLETYRPVQNCNRIALPSPLPYTCFVRFLQSTVIILLNSISKLVFTQTSCVLCEVEHIDMLLRSISGCKESLIQTKAQIRLTVRGSVVEGLTNPAFCAVRRVSEDRISWARSSWFSSEAPNDCRPCALKLGYATSIH